MRGSATVTSGGVETIQRSCSTSTEEIEVVLVAVTFAGVTSEPGGEYYLIAQEVESGEYRRGMSSTYTTRARTRGVVLHMLEGWEACTEGAMIHKVAVRKCGHEQCTKGAHQQVLMHAYVVQ